MNIDIQKIDSALSNSVVLITLKNDAQHSLSITNYGGIIHAWLCPDNKGNVSDVLLGCKNISDYQKNHPYFGAIVGRYANRIANGKFTIDDVTYKLARNNPPHHLHGGNVGFDKKIWDYQIIENSDNITIHLSTESPHLEEGYPGNLKIQVSYTFDNEGQLTIDYEATSDLPTHINLTNHCYFNLSGDNGTTILDHHLQINADSITETDELLIPTGKIMNIKASNLDFSEMTEIGLRIKNDDPNLNKANGYDHNYVISGQINSVAAIAQHPRTGRRLQVFTTEPGIQLYTGNWLNDVNGKNGLYQNYAGFCLETQHYPDSPNHPNFPSTLLKPNETYRSKTIYKIDLVS